MISSDAGRGDFPFASSIRGLSVRSGTPLLEHVLEDDIRLEVVFEFQHALDLGPARKNKTCISDRIWGFAVAAKWGKTMGFLPANAKLSSKLDGGTKRKIGGPIFRIVETCHDICEPPAARLLATTHCDTISIAIRSSLRCDHRCDAIAQPGKRHEAIDKLRIRISF